MRSPGDHTSKIWLTGIRSFRGYNPCFTPSLITTRVQKLCTKFRKGLSPFRQTFRLHNIFRLLRALLLEPPLPGRGRQLQTQCSSTLMRSRNTVRHCSIIPSALEGLITDLSDTTKPPLWQAGDLSNPGLSSCRFPRGIAWKLQQKLLAIQCLLRV